MPTCCCVPLCSNRGGVSFPDDKELRKKWLIAIRRDKFQPKQHTIVCHAHFTENDYLAGVNYHGAERRKKCLKKGAVPSVFEWTKLPANKIQEKQRREERVLQRSEQSKIEPDMQEPFFYEEEVHTEVQVSHTEEEMDTQTQHVEHSTQTAAQPRLSVCDLQFDKDAMLYYTGLRDYDTFIFVLSTLGPGAERLQYRWGKRPSLSTENQFLITLIKLRRHPPNFELAFLFGCSEYVVSCIFVTWINFMYRQWSRLDSWPSRELVSYYMPKDFKKKFPQTRVIIDGMEVPIKKPGKPAAQKVTYSCYKNRNTLKTIIGITPGGVVSHIPESYGGSASDRLLVQDSDLLEKCDPKDSIMADKGFNIQDMAAPYDIKVNIPTFVRGVNQLLPTKLKDDRQISSKRTHVERLIGFGKTYRILVEPLNDVETVLGSRIISVCLMLCNFRPCIVPNTA